MAKGAVPRFNGPKTPTRKTRQTSTALKAQTPLDVPNSSKESIKMEQSDVEIKNASAGTRINAFS